MVFPRRPELGLVMDQARADGVDLRGSGRAVNGSRFTFVNGSLWSGWGIAAVAVLVIAVLAVRVPLLSQTSGDYTAFISPWYDFITSHGGFAALKYNFADYGPPYLYLLAAASYLPVSKFVAIKLISVLFDLLLGYFGYRIVALRFSGWMIPLTAAAVLMLAPTVVVNSADWGQCDSIYTSFCVGSLYFLLRRKPVWAAVLFGIALSFKLQAVFFAPVALIVLCAQRPPLRKVGITLLMVPAAFLAMLVPAVALGANVADVLSVYPQQIASAGSGTQASLSSTSQGFSQFGRAASGIESATRYTFNAPNVYQWVAAGASAWWKYAGMAATCLCILAAGAVAWSRRRVWKEMQHMLLASALLIAIPFLLPGMHERYFYLADVVTILTCFYDKRFWPVAAVVQVCSLLAYAPFLWNTTIIPLPIVAVGELLALAASILLLLRSVRAASRDVPESTIGAATVAVLG